MTSIAKAKIGILGWGGGYMAAPALIIQMQGAMENVEAFIKVVKVYGAYS